MACAGLATRLLAGFRCCLVGTSSVSRGRASRISFSTSPSLRTVRLAYTKFEPEKSSGPPVTDHPLFLLHGLYGSKQNWMSLGRMMADKLNQTVFGVDSRNHGESPHDSDNSYDAMCEDVEALLQKLGIPRGIFVGASMGGKTAMCLALRKVDLVDTLIVLDTSPSQSPESNIAESKLFAAEMQKIQAQPGETLPALRKRTVKEMENAIPELGSRQYLASNLIEKDGKVEWRLNVEVLEKHLDEVMGFPDFNNSYNGAVLFIKAGDSHWITEAEKPEIMRLFPKAEFVVINGAGHGLPLEKPKEVVEHVVKFLKNKKDQ